MDDIEQKVALCFSNVFPDVPKVELPGASRDSLVGWDSIAHVTLLSSIAEEFGIDLEPEDFESLDSYSSIVDWVEAKRG